ncbi:hypothetical protein E4U22_000884 [Claviceps purpurea]|nr:hypothetical protein E4U26_004850 [Claviceps purpurea]KAG6230027.1 hypothetical protein E4U34_001660 [Claviceps purpurea]KAG6263927.1 hypothetical protein E4U47_007134 [Claviceps purpurea]KAG6313518.1 hypothetical protein E4U22_000884 [Claviceps purpurea]
MALERPAATYVDSSENLRHIRFLTDRYCPTVVEIQPDYYPNVDFYQEYDEPLTVNHSRALTTLHIAGGRDKPLSTTDSLSPLESHTFRDFVNRFVRGLYDKASCQHLQSVKTDLGSYPLELRPAAESRNQYVNVLSRCLGETPGHWASECPLAPSRPVSLPKHRRVQQEFCTPGKALHFTSGKALHYLESRSDAGYTPPSV